MQEVGPVAPVGLASRRTSSGYESEIVRSVSMSSAKPALPQVVSHEEWLAARNALLVKEKALTHARDALAAERRRMPMARVEKQYVFEGPNGKVSLLDLFDGRQQLL